MTVSDAVSRSGRTRGAQADGTAARRLPRWLDRILPNVDIEGESLATHADVVPATPVPAEHEPRHAEPALRG